MVLLHQLHQSPPQPMGFLRSELKGPALAANQKRKGVAG